MRMLPSGSVTLLFTDIDGSTRLLHELGQETYADALAEHRRVLREAFAANGGVEVDTQGDAFFFAFPSARGAVAAAAEAQRALTTGPVLVRIGLHTGTPHVTAEGYVGEDVHLGARVAASGHGGQVLLSKATRELVDAVEVRDLGEHRLKDFEEPVWIYQLGDALFPPLKTISNSNLPRPASSFVGREREVSEVTALLRGSRLVTLTGPGGSGKTRLAIEGAAELVGEFRNGVYWVGLSALRDPELVLPTIARTLGAREELAVHIGERELLLLLDNLEQVVQIAPELASLVESCPNLKLIATSREMLRVRCEVEYEVLPLADPEAVELFCLRSGLSAAKAVGELCRRLDNMPLAIELAAARAKVLSAEQILERLSQRLDLFKGGRDADPRQATLRATIEWSYELLVPDEQRLFGRLSLFTGGCTLDAAESVAEADLDTLQALAEKSLLRHSDERFWMLETIREFAVERLEASGAAAGWRSRHAEHFLTLAEQVEPELLGERQAEWLELLERDYANLRAALAWFLHSEAPGPALRLAGALRSFWFKRGYLSEGRRWLDEVLAAPGERTQARAKALATAGLLAALQGDWPETKRWSEAGRRLSLALGKPRFAAWSLMTLGRATLAEGNAEGAISLFEEAETYGREAGDVDTLGMVAFNLGYIALSSGDFDRARTEFEVAVERCSEERYIVARSLAALGSVALHERRHDDAVETLKRSLQVSRELGDKDDIAWALELFGVALSESQPECAARLLGTAEALREALGGRLEGVELDLHERALAALVPLEPQIREEAWAAGHKLSLDEAVEYALSVDSRT